MFLLVCLALCLAAAVLLLPLALRRYDTLKRYSAPRLVVCPENKQSAVVRMDAGHAAESAIDGTPDLRMCECTRWPERSACGQECLSQAVQPEPAPSFPANPRIKQIYHLPVLLAAFAAWCLGAVWHAQYTFRPQWITAAGITSAQVHQLVWGYSLHLLTLGVWVLFAYGVAWLLALWHRKGVLPGVLMAVLLCGAVAASNSYNLAKLPHDLLLLEAGYIVLATLAVGAIVGGLFDKLVLRLQ